TAILNNVSSASEGNIEIVYAQERGVENVLVIPLTSDKGLCGAFNSNILKTTVYDIKTRFVGKNVTVMPLGKKALDFFKKHSYPLITNFSGVFSDVSFENAREAAEYTMAAFEKGAYDQVVLVYNQFKNVATQIVQVEQFLPIPKS